MPHSAFLEMPLSRVHGLMASHHALLTGVPFDKGIKFDEEGLQSLRSLDAPIKIRDFNGEDHFATLDQVLQSSRRSRGTMVSTWVPLSLTEIRKTAFCSEIEAWLLTEGSSQQQYPTSLMRWGLCSTGGAHQPTRIDSEGLGTFLDVVCGEALVFIFSMPKADAPRFSSVRDFLVDFSRQTAPSQEKFRLEVVDLTPGTRL